MIHGNVSHMAMFLTYQGLQRRRFVVLIPLNSDAHESASTRCLVRAQTDRPNSPAKKNSGAEASPTANVNPERYGIRNKEWSKWAIGILS